MDKNQPFFDPYNFNNIPTNMPMDNNINGIDNITNPMMFYEQQYMYYRYLTQVLEYRIKLREYENLNNSKNN